MAFISLIAGGVTLAAAGYKTFKGLQQSSEANAMHPTNPGYEMNRGVLSNAKTLSDNYGNYQLPGYSLMKSNIDSNYGSAFHNGVQGATSGGDVLDLATKMAYGKNQALNQLGIQSAQGKQAAFGDYLNGQAAAGQEYQNKNLYDRGQYDAALKQKAALTQAGATNTYGGIDQLAGAIGPAIAKMNVSSPSYPTGETLTPQTAPLSVPNAQQPLSATGLPASVYAADGTIDLDLLNKYIAKSKVI